MAAAGAEETTKADKRLDLSTEDDEVVLGLTEGDLLTSIDEEDHDGDDGDGGQVRLAGAAGSSARKRPVCRVFTGSKKAKLEALGEEVEKNGKKLEAPKKGDNGGGGGAPSKIGAAEVLKQRRKPKRTIPEAYHTDVCQGPSREPGRRGVARRATSSAQGGEARCKDRKVESGYGVIKATYTSNNVDWPEQRRQTRQDQLLFPVFGRPADSPVEAVRTNFSLDFDLLGDGGLVDGKTAAAASSAARSYCRQPPPHAIKDPRVRGRAMAFGDLQPVLGRPRPPNAGQGSDRSKVATEVAVQVAAEVAAWHDSAVADRTRSKATTKAADKGATTTAASVVVAAAAEASREEQDLLDVTPEAPATPGPQLETSGDWDESLGGEGDLSFAQSVAFSDTASLASVGDSSSRLNDSKDSGSDLNESFSKQEQDQLDTSFVDRILDNQTAEEQQGGAELMDWEEVDPDVLLELHRCRKQVLGQTSVPEEPSDDELKIRQLGKISSSSDSSPDSQVFVVVDTNVFIVGLDHLKSLLTDGNGLGHGLIFYLPWAVVRELDNLKGRGNRSEGQQGGSNRNIEASARRAISFLLSELQRGNDKLCCQTGAQEKEAEVYKAYNADDRILQTCLKLKSEGKTVILYTNDKNLATKTIISGIEACSSTRFSRAIAEVKMTLAVSENRQTLVQGVNNDVAALPVNDVEMASIDDEDDSESACHTSNQEDFEEFLYSILYKILVTEMEQRFGQDLWKLVVIVKPRVSGSRPWTISEIFHCISHHWEAVFVPIKEFNQGMLSFVFRELAAILCGKMCIGSGCSWSHLTHVKKLTVIENVKKILLSLKNRNPYKPVVPSLLNELSRFRPGWKGRKGPGQPAGAPETQAGIASWNNQNHLGKSGCDSDRFVGATRTGEGGTLVVGDNRAGLEDLNTLFVDVWNAVHKLTLRYCLNYKIDTGKLPTLPLSQLPQIPLKKESVLFLDCLFGKVSQLTTQLGALAKIPPFELAVNRREMLDFHGSLTSILFKLDRARVEGVSPSPDHKPIPPELMLRYLLKQECRTVLMETARIQLVHMRDLLGSCQRKANQV